MVLYGNNYNRKFNLSTAVLAGLAAVIVNLIWNTVTDIQASNGGGEQGHSVDAAGVALLVLAGALLVLIAVGILFTIVSAHVWPVDVKDLLRVMAGHPGSLLELANKCNRCGVSSIVAFVVRAIEYRRSRLCVLYFVCIGMYNLSSLLLYFLNFPLNSEISGASSLSCGGEKEL
jgi:hypothetical protein